MLFKYSYSIHPHTKKGSTKCSLYLLVSINSERKEISLGISCPLIAFDRANKTILQGSYPDAAIDNLHLQQKLAAVERTIKAASLSNDSVTLLSILTALEDDNAFSSSTKRAAAPDASALTIAQAYQRYYDNALLSKGWGDGTAKHHRSVGNHLCSVLGNRYINTLNDSDLTLLLKSYKSELRANTLAKLISDIKCFLRECYRMGIYNGKCHETFSPKIKGANEDKEIIFLTQAELQLLESHTWDNSQQHLERVVDAFLFACFSGLRHSDIFNLKRTNIIDDGIMIRMIKTSKPLSIPLNDHTRSILKKYADYQDRKNHPFPVISNQKSNDYIKEACKLCGIDTPTTISYYQDNRRIEVTQPKYELVTFHCSRRTFCTQALILGIRPEILIKFTGHSSTKQLRHYMEVTDELKHTNMSFFNSI